MAIPNCTYYESLVWGNPVRRERGIDKHGMVPAPPGLALACQWGRVPGGAYAICCGRRRLTASTFEDARTLDHPTNHPNKEDNERQLNLTAP